MHPWGLLEEEGQKEIQTLITQEIPGEEVSVMQRHLEIL